MQKQILTRDYGNFDYLDVTVKKDGIERLTAHYAALGWDCVDARDDKFHRDIERLVLRRPHRIANKDELQLLQIYLESAWNAIGRAAANPCPVTLAAGLAVGLVSLAAMVLGLLCGLGVLRFLPHIWGYTLFGAGIICAAVNAAACVKCRKAELKKTEEKAKRAVREIEAVYSSAARLTGGGAEIEAAAGDELEAAGGGE